MKQERRHSHQGRFWKAVGLQGLPPLSRGAMWVGLQVESCLWDRKGRGQEEGGLPPWKEVV